MSELVKSPLPGKLIEYQVKRGDQVSPGEVVAIVESMKMYNEIASEKGGKVKRLIAFPDSYVAANGDLLELE